MYTEKIKKMREKEKTEKILNELMKRIDRKRKEKIEESKYNSIYKDIILEERRQD